MLSKDPCSLVAHLDGRLFPLLVITAVCLFLAVLLAALAALVGSLAAEGRCSGGGGGGASRLNQHLNVLAHPADDIAHNMNTPYQSGYIIGYTQKLVQQQAQHSRDAILLLRHPNSLAG